MEFAQAECVLATLVGLETIALKDYKISALTAQYLVA